MWLIQIRALRKKLQLTLRRKGVSEKEKEMWRGRLGQGVGAGTGRWAWPGVATGEQATEIPQLASWSLVFRKDPYEGLQHLDPVSWLLPVQGKGGKWSPLI